MSLIANNYDVTPETISTIWEAIDSIGFIGVDYYPLQIELITASQMLDYSSTIGLPVCYDHWAFGKAFLENEEQYLKGKSRIPYEMVINSNPCIAYLVETNNMLLNTVVLCHAGVGHNSFFKNNYLFQTWTIADYILDYMKYAKAFIKKCEVAHGEARVTDLIDKCRSLAAYGVDRCKRNRKSTGKRLEERKKEWAKHFEESFDEVTSTINSKKAKRFYEQFKLKNQARYPYPEENILYFIEKYSLTLKKWEKEIVRIIRKTEQYFYPQRLTKLMNEGWATFVHYEMMSELYNKGMIDEGNFLEFLCLQANLTYTASTPHLHPYLNPYSFGFKIFQEIKRICVAPTEEDKQYFPHMIGKDWKEEVIFAVKHFNDASFIQQYLTPNLIRNLKLFIVEWDFQESKDCAFVTHIATPNEFKNIKNKIVERYKLEQHTPKIEIVSVDWEKTRVLTLEYTEFNSRELVPHELRIVMQNLTDLWGGPVKLLQNSTQVSITRPNE